MTRPGERALRQSVRAVAMRALREERAEGQATPGDPPRTLHAGAVERILARVRVRPLHTDEALAVAALVATAEGMELGEAIRVRVALEFDDPAAGGEGDRR